MKAPSLILALTFLPIIAPVLFAQPEGGWERLIDATDQFYDVYTIDEGGYILSGQTERTHGLTRIDNDGGLVWANRYPFQDEYVSCGFSVIEADNGDFVSVGFTFMAERNNQGDDRAYNSVIRINDQGEPVWIRSYQEGSSWAVIELKSGEFVICGQARTDDGQAYQGLVYKIEGNGDLIWERSYPGRWGYRSFRAMRETDGGVVVCGLEGGPNDGPENFSILMKIDMAGEVIWLNSYGMDRAGGDTRYETTSIVSNPDGFAMVGRYTPNDERAYSDRSLFLTVDARGGVINEILFAGERGTGNQANCLARLNNGNYVFVGSYQFFNQDYNVDWMEGWYSEALAKCVNPQGEEVWNLTYDPLVLEEIGGNAHFNSVVTGHNGAIIAAGQAGGMNRQMDDFETQGFVVNLGNGNPDDEGGDNDDSLLHWTHIEPLGRSSAVALRVLLGNSIDFSVLASNNNAPDRDSILYAYYVNGALINIGPEATIQFDSLGLAIVDVVAWDGVEEITWRWDVTVVDFLIDEWEPQPIRLSGPRNSEFDFFISAGSIYEEQIEYEWRLDEREVDRAQSYNHVFEQIDDYVVKGFARQGDRSDSLQWLVEITSPIRSWTPGELDFVLAPESVCEFTVEPTRPNSDSLWIAWIYQNRVVSNEPFWTVAFDQIGVQNVSVFVGEGEAVDSVSWTVRVESMVVDRQDLGGWSLAIQGGNLGEAGDVAISFTLLSNQLVELQLIDVTGRVIDRVTPRSFVHGTHYVNFGRRDLAAGLYFVVLSTPEKRLVRKIVRWR